MKGAKISPQVRCLCPTLRQHEKNGKRKTHLSVINIEDFSGLTNGEADMIFPSVGREELGKK